MKISGCSNIASYSRIGIPVSSSFNDGEYNISDDELKIMAWLITDGNISSDGRVTFYQRESKHKMITDILDNLDWNYKVFKRDRDIREICGRKLKKKCEISCEIKLNSNISKRCSDLVNGDKHLLPDIIYRISNRQFDIFLSSFIDGDGSRHKSAPETSFMVYGKKDILLELQRACFLHNYRTSLSIYREKDYRLNITKNKIAYIDNFSKRISIKNYNGKIWCVRTKNDTVIVRRNGKISITGNSRVKDYFDLSPMEILCGNLAIPYMGISGVINFKVGRRRLTENNKNPWRENYMIYFHHSTGGGSTIGGGLNRAEKLGNIVEGVDCYCAFHSHKLSVSRSIIFRPSQKSKRMEEKTITHLTCGGYLQYEDSYAERGMLRPTKLGSPRIRLDSAKHDLHVSL
jgi:hypothetical protein